MVSQHGIKLAVHLVSSFFGDHNAKVCDCLLRRGTLTLPLIMRYTELSKENVRHCLLALIHQNCVQAFSIQQEGAFGEAPKVITQYMALFDNIIHRMRFPKFMGIVSEELGEDCEKIFKLLLQHGRLSLSQITVDKGENSTLESLQENFNKLVHGRFVERCPAPEPFLEPPPEEQPPAKKRGTKSSKVVELTIEQRALVAAAPLDSLRFVVEAHHWDDASTEKSEGRSTDVTTAEKRKRDVFELDGSPLDKEDKKEVLWRVNAEEFLLRLRNKVCVENVRSRFGTECGTVLSAVLELDKGSNGRVDAGRTASFTITTIYDEIIKEGHLSMNLERITDCLVQMGCQRPMIEIDEPYSIDLKSIIERAQTEEVESIVLKRYGREAYRMFRLISQKGHLLETDKIADATFIEKKDAIRVLYKLWKDDYLQMEKVNVSGGGPGGGKAIQLMLWKVNKMCLWEHVLDEMYHAALNLRHRMAHDLEQEKQVL
ncbi:OLC1v1027425C1 [Oldenlandia corymbosa var. corymbosa]|uniref:DNA-directed RNA polymerase III subunit RPC3 n=1 Tax=Oldenlandia corymbosa var. corymbosa TaxID=529605 RepID=A0AAV1CBE8_OLDCO|nr:OLC1v1027425C1 [Oldenlandia corymbosa var. corymbosa]